MNDFTTDIPCRLEGLGEIHSGKTVWYLVKRFVSTSGGENLKFRVGAPSEPRKFKSRPRSAASMCSKARSSVSERPAPPTSPQPETSDFQPRRERARRVRSSSISERTESRQPSRTPFPLRIEGLKSLATFPTRSSRNSPNGAAPCQPGPDGAPATVGPGTAEETGWRPERPGQRLSRPFRPPPRGRPDFPGRRSQARCAPGWHVSALRAFSAPRMGSYGPYCRAAAPYRAPP